ncbi:MAG TPA: HAMP domain-containing sensor histidine kinase [Solirubrobacteraceae bacterium]|jgi:two-component system sensor histidine kinase MprB|nr:HAMP domain-containing sensor histidine kinase [Solirubrobacteraceae bacterium]
MSLRGRMGLAGGVAVALAVIAVAVSAYAGTSSELHSQLDQSLGTLNTQILAHSGIAPGGGPSQGTGPPGRGGDNGPGGPQQRGRFDPNDPDEGLGLDFGSGPALGGPRGVFTLIRPAGTTWTPRGQTAIPATPAFKRIAASGHGSAYTDMTVNGDDIRVLATGIGRFGALMVAQPLKDVDSALSQELLLLVIIAAAGIMLAALLGILVARTALAPIARFTRQTEAIAAHPDRLDSERLDVHGGDELARLASTFNRTLDALERSVQSQRNLVADASHELRTPIATIRANLQLMRDEALLSPEDREGLRTDVIEELDELTALVGDVVELARGSKPAGEPGEVRVDQIVVAAVDRTRRRAPQLTVEVSLEPTLVYGEGDRIARAVGNLLDNAAKYGQPGGLVEVTLADGVLTVRDHGPGFHEEDLPYLFDRFHRARDARSHPGSGLGLAIVRQAAEAHAGFVEAANAPGGGAVLRIGFGPTLELEEAPEHGAASPS